MSISEKIKTNLPDILKALVLSWIIAVVCNMVGYDFSLMESIPGLFILSVIVLVGYLLSWIVNIDKLSSVLWISIIAILVASPISPISETVIYHVNNISLMSVVTPILAYAGVIIGKDWESFKKVGLKGVIVSCFVMAGTFLISSLMGDFFMNIF